jgi:two-component sensor histidine kinase
VALRVEAEPTFLGIDVAVPCGLILNELLSNCLKHAFPDGRAGMIDVRIHEEGERLAIVVRDDGVGLPPDLDPSHAESLGLRLVAMLVEQLHAEVVVERAGGTAVHVTLPVEETH